MHYSCINLCDLLYRAIKSENYLKTELQSKELERLYLGSYFCGNYFLGIMEGAIKKLSEDCNQSVLYCIVYTQSNLQATAQFCMMNNSRTTEIGRAHV